MNATGSRGRDQSPTRPYGADTVDSVVNGTVPRSMAESVDQVRGQVDRLCWTGILLGLAFTMTNVQGFAANGAAVWSLSWLAAWLLDPMVSLVLLAILRAEQVTARHGVHTGGWVRGAKWFTLAATYVMNTWAAFAAGSAALVVLHSVPPLVVFMAAEAVTDLRDNLAQAMTAQALTARSADTGLTENLSMDAVSTDEPSMDTAFTNAPSMNAVTAGTDHNNDQEDAQPVNVGGRRSFAQYLAVARAAYRPDVTVTPVWVREATGCSRGLSYRLAATLTEQSTPQALNAVDSVDAVDGDRGVRS
jgi:hypothetical protein